MKILSAILAVLVLVALVAVIAQHLRYHDTRRNRVADRQRPLHSSSVFHVVTLVRLEPGQDLRSGMRALVAASEGAGAQAIYAGKIAFNAIQSQQLPDEEWQAFLLAQYPSRAAYDAAAGSPELEKARVGFAASYALGMQRSAAVNLAIPIGLLGLRIGDIATRRPARYPFERGDDAAAPPELRERRDRFVESLLAERGYGKDALVVLNFMKEGNTEERQANAGYGREMMGLMAEMGNGPMHLGRAVTLEGNADFDTVAIVYYPGVEYFAEMIQSRFFGGIAGGKQLGDTLATPSVPLLPHL